MQCGYCGTEIAENEDFCKKCVESYKIDDKPIKNTPEPRISKFRTPTLPKKQSTSQTLIGRLIGFVIAGFIFGFIMYVVQAWR